MKRIVTLKFVKGERFECKRLAEVEVNSDIRIPNIGEHYHYASGLKFDFLSSGSVVDILTTYFSRNGVATEEIVVTIDICK